MSRFEASGLCASLGNRPILFDVDIAVESGEVLGLLGPNASGKTTLLRALANLIEPTAGTVRLDGVPTASLPRAGLARCLAYLEQGARSEWPLSVQSVVALGRAPWLGPWSRASKTDGRAIAAAMTLCDVTTLAHRPVTALSGGEQARVMLARALAGSPEILLADEPVTHLDPFHQLQVMEVIRAHAKERGGAVIAVLHDLALAAKFCDRLVLLHHGRVAAEGPPSVVLTEETLARVFSISAAFVDDGDGIMVVPRRRIGNPAENAR